MAAWAFEPSMSSRHSRLSTPTEALIAFMAGEGAPANRPPHMSCPPGPEDLGLKSVMNVQSGSEPPEPKAPAPAAPRSWALAAGLALLGLGVIAALYVLFAASSKPEAAGYARFAQGPLSRLAVLEDAPPQPTAELRDAAGA